MPAATPRPFWRAERFISRARQGRGSTAPRLARGDAAAQARQACENIRQLLEEAGGDLSHVVKLTNYITDRAYRKAVYAVIAEYFGPHAPASTGVIVDGLASEDFLVEIDATAYIPEA